MQVPNTHSFSGVIRRAGRLVAPTVILVLVLQAAAVAAPPLQEWRHFSFTGQLLPGATAACGFPVYRDFEGDGHFIVFYDQDGAIIREVDTFPSFTSTIYAPSTGRSYTSASPAVLTTYYTGGAAVGTPAIAVITGLVEKAGTVDLNSGREVWNAFVRNHDAAGVPLIKITTEISSSGPDWDTTLGAARCAAVR